MLKAGAKALLKSESSPSKDRAKDKKQRKERLKREAAAKAKLLQQGE